MPTLTLEGTNKIIDNDLLKKFNIVQNFEKKNQ